MKDFKSLIITIGAMFLFSQIPSAQSNLMETDSYESKLKEILEAIEVRVPHKVSKDALEYGYRYLKTSNHYCKTRTFTRTLNRRKIEACEQWLQDAVAGLNQRLGNIDPYTHVHLTTPTIPTETNSNLKVVRKGPVIYVQYKKISGNYLEDSLLLRDKLNRAKAQSASPPKLIILDLRGNVGGLVYQAVEVIDLFLAKGRVATLSYYSDLGTNIYWDAEPQQWSDRWLEQIPIAIITDKKTASAAEIIVTALLDNGRAQIHIGEKTFGKAVFQNIFEEYFYELRVTEGITKRLRGGSYNLVGIAPRQQCDKPMKPTSALYYACRFLDNSSRLTASN